MRTSTKNLKNFFLDIIHVINLDTNQPVDPYANPDLQRQILRIREERALSMVRQSKIQGFAIRFWEGVTLSANFGTNICKAMKLIVRHAKEMKYQHVTIAEDDCSFTQHWGWKYYLDNMPRDFDIYSGGIYSGEVRVDETGKHRIYNGFSGMTLFTVHNDFYDFFLRADESKHIDRWLGESAFHNRYYVCHPFVTKQLAPGYSENLRRRIDSYISHEEQWEYL
jgi:hypothetical protein